MLLSRSSKFGSFFNAALSAIWHKIFFKCSNTRFYNLSSSSQLILPIFWQLLLRNGKISSKAKFLNRAP